jgi:hypothetical protein
MAPVGHQEPPRPSDTPRDRPRTVIGQAAWALVGQSHPLTMQQLKTLTRRNSTTLGQRLADLTADGLVVQTGRGVHGYPYLYQLTLAGAVLLAQLPPPRIDDYFRSLALDGDTAPTPAALAPTTLPPP